jgi:hypothetical protein
MLNELLSKKLLDCRSSATTSQPPSTNKIQLSANTTELSNNLQKEIKTTKEKRIVGAVGLPTGTICQNSFKKGGLQYGQ